MAKYNHQPFEDWVYSRETISPQEELALQEHLQECKNCLSLVDALDEVELCLKIGASSVTHAGLHGSLADPSGRTECQATEAPDG